MTQEELISLINSPKELAETQLQELIELSVKYPYSSTIHSVLAKIAKEFNTEDASHHLSIAAIYTSDRSKLKEYINLESSVLATPIVKEAEEEPSIEEEEEVIQPEDITPTIEETRIEEKIPEEITPEPKEEITEEQVEEIEKQAAVQEVKETAPTPLAKEVKPESRISHEDLYAELQANLNKLKGLKEQALQSQEDLPKEKENPKEKKEVKTAKKAVKKKESVPKTVVKKKAEKEKPKKKVIRKKKSLSSQKEQTETINKFISEEPVLPRADEMPNTTTEDLTKNRQELGEELYTENLALIMIKQGQVEYAKKIYQQLMLKNPQKKAYFASLLEKIQKK